MHPSFEVEKTYLAEVVGTPARDLGRRLRAGIELDDGAGGRALVQASSTCRAAKSLVELVLHEGRKHIVRRAARRRRAPGAATGAHRDR